MLAANAKEERILSFLYVLCRSLSSSSSSLSLSLSLSSSCLCLSSVVSSVVQEPCHCFAAIKRCELVET